MIGSSFLSFVYNIGNYLFQGERLSAWYFGMDYSFTCWPNLHYNVKVFQLFVFLYFFFIFSGASVVLIEICRRFWNLSFVFAHPP